MSLLDQRRKSLAAHSPSPSPSPSSILQRTGGVSPTRRSSSRKLSSSRVLDAPPPLRRSTSRRISRHNPPHVNHDIAKSQFATMNSRPHTPVHHDSASTDTSTTLVNPTSTILQGLIKEQRATRGSRKTIPHLSDDIDRRPITSHSHSHSHGNSPSEKQRRINSLVASDLKQPRDMGIREMDQYVSKMNKLNFDLKLDIFHRTQQIAALEKKMERMHEMEEELERMHDLEDELDELREVEENNQRLREANEQLQSELDRRDQAISEAVELICQLESKVEELRAGRSESIPSATTPVPRDSSTFIADDASEVCTPKAEAFVDIPDRTSSRKGTARHRPRKSPSFLREESRSTAALRSLFMAEENRSVRSVSASTMATTLDSMADPQSPRLSILSECSYFSPQDIQPKGAGFDQLDRLDQLNLADNGEANLVAPTNNNPNGHLSHRITDWMKLDGHTSQSGSNNNNPRRRTRALSDVSRGSQVPVTRLDEPFELVRKSRPSHHPNPRHPQVADFGGNLPPTPDTMSTFRPGFENGSNASLPVDKLVRSRAALDTSPSTFARLNRPRSADEITTRPPSITMSAHSDAVDTTASVVNNMDLGDKHQASGLFSSFNHFGRASAKANRLLGPGSPSNPRVSCYGGDLLFNGEGVENVVSGMQMTPTSSFKSDTPVKVSNELPPSSPLTPQEWLEAAKTEERPEETDDSSVKLVTEEKPLGIQEMDHVAPATADEGAPGGLTTFSHNPPLRLRAWANDSQPVAEVQTRRRLSLRPRFFTRNRQQQESQPESMTLNNKGPSPVPDKSLSISKHRRSSSGPGLNSEEPPLKSAAGRSSSRPLSKPVSDLRPSTASRPMTSDSNEPRSKGSLFRSWMKGSHKDSDAPPTSHAVVARTGSERPKSTATIDISTLNLTRTSELAPPAADDEPVWRARRRSRRMA